MGVFSPLFFLLPSFFFLALSVGAEVPFPERFSLFDREVQLQADGSRGPYRISDRAIIWNSERVWVGGTLQVRDVDYSVDADRAQVTFFHLLPRGTAIVIRFEQAPQLLAPMFGRRPVFPDMPKRGPDRRVVGNYPTEEAHRLDLGGSKRIGISFGSDRAHTLDQALQVRVAGEVAEGVSVLALLSDHNLPVGEGSHTRALRELDRVFFQVQSGDFSAELGDLDLGFGLSEFAAYQRQLQGARVSLSQGAASGRAVGAVSRGEWTTRRLSPLEGYQGPYRLSEGMGHTGRIVPESERVFLNGRLLKRGDRLDYVIDYERGTVLFSPEVPIVAESRIAVDYQVVADGVQSRVLGAEGQVSREDGRMTLGATVIRETDRALIPEGAGSGIPLAHRQVATFYTLLSPADGVVVRGEAGMSDRETGTDQAYRLNGHWAGGPFRVFGAFRQVGSRFQGFERFDKGLEEGRWGWQPTAPDERDREAEVGLRYAPAGRWALEVGLGRRGGSLAGQRRSLVVHAPFGFFDTNTIGKKAGELSRQSGQVSFVLGRLRPGFRMQRESGWGDGVGAASVFYARGNTPLPGQVEVRELVWDVETGSPQRWLWRSELRHRFLGADGKDSIRALAQAHRVELNNLRGWSLSGGYSRGTTQTGRALPARQVTHLGRGQVRFARPGFSHQVSYRISSTGVRDLRPIFVYVGRGLGSYVWEDVDGDGVQDPAEFVPDVDGDYEMVYADEGDFHPSRDGALGARAEVDFGRLIDPGGWLSQVAVDVSLSADRQAVSVMPWQMVGFSADSTVLGGQRDVWARVFLFRFHTRGSVQFSSRWRDRVNPLFFGGGAESRSERGMLGRLRIFSNLDAELEGQAGTRGRVGAGVFSYDILERTGGLRLLWRPKPGWQVRTGGSGGADQDRARGLRVTYLSTSSELIRSLPGRGRLRAGLDWTRVSADGTLPFFLGMAKGNRPGQNFLWRLGLDYRLGRYVTALVHYDGRKRPEGPTVHMGRMEVRAVF